MDGPIISYVRICDDPLTHGGNLDPFWAQRMFFCLFLQEFCDFFWELGLMLSIISKDAVFAEMLVSSKIFGFPTINMASIWTETVNFNCIPSEPKFKILKDFSNSVFLIGDYLWSKF